MPGRGWASGTHSKYGPSCARPGRGCGFADSDCLIGTSVIVFGLSYSWKRISANGRNLALPIPTKPSPTTLSRGRYFEQYLDTDQMHADSLAQAHLTSPVDFHDLRCAFRPVNRRHAHLKHLLLGRRVRK